MTINSVACHYPTDKEEEVRSKEQPGGDPSGRSQTDWATVAHIGIFSAQCYCQTQDCAVHGLSKLVYTQTEGFTLKLVGSPMH